MSGHSHWATVKHKKGAEDAKRGKLFSKLSRVISVAAREKGGDPDSNPTLRMAIEKARAANMPKDNIERAIKRGTGELAGDQLEEVIFEAFGPGGIAIIIAGITDNKNRTLGEIKQILNQYNGKLAGEGSVRWQFERKGELALELLQQPESLQNKEQLELAAIEAGGEDTAWQENILLAYSSPDGLDEFKKAVEVKGMAVAEATLVWKPKEEMALGEKARQAAEKLFDTLDDNDAVQDIYSNLKV